MRLLLDHCVPRRFGRLLSIHQVSTAYQMGWSSLKNGELLSRARSQFDAFLTVDQNVEFQQNLSSLPITVVVLVATDNRLDTLRPFAAFVDAALALDERVLVRVEADGKMQIVR
jgi:hypothetical protein